MNIRTTVKELRKIVDELQSSVWSLERTVNRLVWQQDSIYELLQQNEIDIHELQGNKGYVKLNITENENEDMASDEEDET